MVTQTLCPLKKSEYPFVAVFFVLLYSLLGKGLTEALSHSVRCLPVFLAIPFINKTLNFDV